MNQNEFNTFQNTAFPQINRTGNNKKGSVKRPYTGIGRDAKIDPDMYYHVKEENEQLKKTKLALNQKITKLESNLANIKENIIKERKQADYRVINMGKNSDLDFAKTQYENMKLKSENDKKDLIIQGLQSNYPTKYPKPKKKSKKKDALTTQNVKNDYLALIARLREQLKIANEDRKNLINELKNLKDSYQFNNANYGTNNYMSNKTIEMTNKIADLNTNYENATLKLDTQNKILEMTKKTLEDYINKYEKERENNRKLQAELSVLKGDSEKLSNYKKQLEDYKINEIKLEEELSALRINPFIKQAEERGNVYRSYQISEKKLAETKKILDEKEKLLDEAEMRLKELEKENKELKDNLGIEKIEKEKYKDEALKLKISRAEREKYDKLYEDKLNQFNQYGEVDSNFNKILSLYKNENDQANWGNINFIEPNIEKIDPTVLKNENTRLKMEKNTLGNELQRTKDLLLLQQQANEDIKLLKELEIKKYKAEIKLLKEKIEELCKLIDMKKLPKDKTLSKEPSRYMQSISIPVEPKKSKLLDDNITEFSQEDTDVELGINENALDIYFGECLYEDVLSDEIGYNLEDMLSFFSVDFYVHETQTSDILSGKNPMFNFQLIFKVDINENLLNYLENNYIVVEVYTIRDNNKNVIGKGEVKLKELLDIENNEESISRVISSEVPIYHAEKNNLKIATIYYKMRMRKPLSEAIKWYNQENKMSEELDQMHEPLRSQIEQNIKNYTDLGGKAYEIKILINKAIDLIISGPARRISPYCFYKFYKNGERYTQISSGNNPQFEDVATFNEIFNKDFLEYIEKEDLNIYIFDSQNPIELDVSRDEAKLSKTNQQISKDLIGICSIPLQGLLINDLIQGDFPIYNMQNERVGKLIINIIWEEIKVGINENLINSMQYKTDINQDNLILKLANALKEKGLNVESAFNIFDIDKKNEISLDNFQNTLIYTLKFTTNQIEMDHLIKLIFKNQGRTKLDKVDFYQIFSKLLPSAQLYQTQYNINNVNNLNNMYNTQMEQDNKDINNKQESNPEYVSANQIYNKTNINNKEKNNETIHSNKDNKDRSLNEIGELIAKYKLKKGKSKSDAVDIFKYIFDKDASLGIDKKELDKGFANMGINLTENERNQVWKKMSGNKGSIDFASFKAFHDNYCLISIPSNENTIRSHEINMSGTQISGPFAPNITEYHG